MNQFLGSIFSESPTANEDGTKIVVVDVNSSPKDDPANQKIGHFQVPTGLCIKTRLRAQPLIWKWFFIFMKTHFHNKILCTCWPHFESEGFWNSEVAYCRKSNWRYRFCKTGHPRNWRSTSKPENGGNPTRFLRGIVWGQLMSQRGKASNGNIVEHPPTSAVGLCTAWELWNLRVNGCQAGIVLLPFPLQKKLLRNDAFVKSYISS